LSGLAVSKAEGTETDAEMEGTPPRQMISLWSLLRG
jgi:hypothetical protein